MKLMKKMSMILMGILVCLAMYKVGYDETKGEELTEKCSSQKNRWLVPGTAGILGTDVFKGMHVPPKAQQQNKQIKQDKEVQEEASLPVPKPVATQEATKSSLEGKVICIDAGHQQKGNAHQEPVAPGSHQTKAKVSSGTKGVATGKYEYALNLEVALKLQAALQDKGATVYMIRKTNEVDISNAERAQFANKMQVDVCIRLHADGSENRKVSGFSILVPGGEIVPKDVITKSKEIADYLEPSLAKGITNKSRGITTRTDLTGFNWSKVPVVLIEMGFMSNAEEDQRMGTQAFQDSFVQSLVSGLESYYSEASNKPAKAN